MSEFSLESIAEKIHNGKTKKYFQEVLSSYHNGNYRSAVVMLWSVAICDIVYKLQYLVDLYGDKTAKSILDELETLQERGPESGTWEGKLVKDTFEKTKLLDSRLVRKFTSQSQ
jgi:Cft2 family RNA processing exonuclease